MDDRSRIREQVWNQLRVVAKPDSRFHLDFSEYIPDFLGSAEACARLYAMGIYRRAQNIFITPDNCLEAVRAQAARDGKVQVVSTYGIRRGFIRLRPADVPIGLARYATLLDALESFGQQITLAELSEHGQFDLVITGASAISLSGVRFGKGHGYFDIEYGMFREIGVVDARTPVVGLVHDCQVLELELEPSPFDTRVDYIVTPTRLIAVDSQHAKPAGIFWDRLSPQLIDRIPPLRELQQINRKRA